MSFDSTRARSAQRRTAPTPITSAADLTDAERRQIQTSQEHAKSFRLELGHIPVMIYPDFREPTGELVGLCDNPATGRLTSHHLSNDPLRTPHGFVRREGFGQDITIVLLWQNAPVPKRYRDLLRHRTDPTLGDDAIAASEAGKRARQGLTPWRTRWAHLGAVRRLWRSSSFKDAIAVRLADCVTPHETAAARRAGFIEILKNQGPGRYPEKLSRALRRAYAEGPLW